MKRLTRSIAAAAILALALVGCTTWPDDPITEGEVTDLYHVRADDGGPRYIGGRPAGRRAATPEAWNTIIKSEDGACRLKLSEGLYNQLAVGDAITMEPCGLILTINGTEVTP